MTMDSVLFYSCLGVVLAGGKSSRMGKNKATLQRDTQDMLSFSKTMLSDAGCADVVVSGGENGVNDLFENLGPLGGIQSVITKFKPHALLILPVDLPLMNAHELAELKRVGELSRSACYFTDNHIPLYLPVNAFVEQFFQQPLVRKPAPDDMSNLSNKAVGKRGLSGPSVRSFLKQVPHKTIAPKNTQSLFNTNTPEQWQQAQHLLSLQRKSYV